MFAALELLESGFQPLIFERGKKIEETHARMCNDLFVNGLLDPESNIQFGEGGAGSYSDGKLFSRMINFRIRQQGAGYVYQIWCAWRNWVYVSKPHVGRIVLCRIVKNVRNYISWTRRWRYTFTNSKRLTDSLTFIRGGGFGKGLFGWSFLFQWGKKGNGGE